MARRGMGPCDESTAATSRHASCRHNLRVRCVYIGRRWNGNGVAPPVYDSQPVRRAVFDRETSGCREHSIVRRALLPRPTPAARQSDTAHRRQYAT